MPFRNRRGLRSSQRNTAKAIRDTVLYCAEALEQRLFLSTTISIANSSAIEPAPNGTVNMNFTATRTGDLTSQVTIGYTTVAGTAQAGTDFTPETGTTTFASGSATATIAIPIFNDGVYSNPNLNFSVQLTGVTNVVGPPLTLALQQTFGTLIDPFSVIAADVNGDGKPDLIVANYGSATVSVLFNTTAAGATTPSFAPQQTFATGNGPLSVTVADVNGDGKPDVIVANNRSNTMSVLLNTTTTGATTPSFAAQQTFATGSFPASVTAADVNGDGKPDLIVANANSNTVSVLLNTTAAGAASASFAAQRTFTTGTKPRAVTAADVNGDGKPDLIVANNGSNTVSVLLNTTTTGATTPSFAAQQTFATGSFPTSVTAADVNGDGKPDLIVANYQSSTVSVLLNTTAAGASSLSFTAQQTCATARGPYSVTTADVNGDGKPDLIVANKYPEAGLSTGSVLLNTTAAGSATPSFAAQQTFPAVFSPTSVTAVDVNGDGKPDLVVTNVGGGSVSVLLNTTVLGAASIVPAFPQATFATGSAPQSVAAADVNGDGKPDLIVSNYMSETVSVLLNTTVPGATIPSFASQQTFATSNEPVSVTAADVNGDGKPDLIVANSVGQNKVSVLLNTTPAGATTASFAAQTTFATGNTPRSVIAADVNGDGKLDLIVANEDNTVSVLLNTTPAGATTASFAPQTTFAAGGGPWAVTAADVNGDGKPDLIVTGGGGSTISVLRNTTPAGATTPSFAAQQTFATGTYPRSVTAADLNGDGKLDLVVTSWRPAAVSVLLNTTGTGATTLAFAAQQTFATGSYPTSVTAADVNGDGKPDLFVANSKSNTMSLLLNATAAGATTPSFAAQQTFATGIAPLLVTPADVNGDGRPDVIAVNESSNAVSVLLNTPVTIATGTATGMIIDPAVFTPVINGDNPNGLYTAAGQPSNGVQRSMVEDVVYTFNLAVTIPNANNAFTIVVANNSGGTVPTTMIATSIADPNNNGIVDGKVWAVSLTGQADGVLASIANGEYTITINPNSVFSAADGTTPIAGGRTDNFFRLFGDMSGQGVLTALDNARLKQALTTYNPAFDYTGNGTAIVALDNARFKQALSINFANDFANMTFVPTI